MTPPALPTPRSWALLGSKALAPPSRSMHESSLQPKGLLMEPKMRGPDLVRTALQRDAEDQSRKYGTGEPSPRSARFNVSLPVCPQHGRYSWWPRPGGPGDHGVETKESKPPLPSAPWPEEPPAPSPPSASPRAPLPVVPAAVLQQSPNRTRFGIDKRKLLLWFQELDKGDTGFVTRRALAVSLQRHPDCSNLFRLGGRHSAEAGASIKGMLSTVGGNMNFDEFVQFFYRAGLLVEYEYQGRA